MDYLAIRTFHETAVAFSVTGFAARAVGGLLGHGWTRGRLARVLPHVVDTALLTSALMMVAMLRLNPFATPWLLAKLGGLVAYVGLGVVALRPTVPLCWRAGAGFAALVVVAWIVSVAILKSPFGVLGLLFDLGMGQPVPATSS